MALRNFLSNPYGKEGFFKMYAESWKFYFHHFILLWGISVVFIVPLNLFQFYISRNFLHPFTSAFIRLDIFGRQGQFGLFSLNPDNWISNFKPEWVAKMSALLDKTIPDLPKVLSISILGQIISALLYYLLFVALLSAIFYISKKKKINLFYAVNLVWKKIRNVLIMLWKIFIHGFVFLFLGLITAQFAAVKALLVMDLWLSSPQGNDKFLLPWAAASGGLAMLALLCLLVGIIILIIRLPDIIAGLPLFLESKLSAEQAMQKGAELVKSKWTKTFFYALFAKLLTTGLIYLIIISVFVAYSAVAGLLMFGNIIDIRTNKENITFIATIFPIFVNSIFLPSLAVFWHRLYKAVNR